MFHLSEHYLKAQSGKPWERKVTVTTTKRKNKKKIVHPLFQQCAEHEDSKFWKRIFEEASTNKFHPKYSFKDNILYCKHGNQVKEMAVPNDPDIAREACKEFFNKNTGLLSPKEREEENRLERQRRNKDKNKMEELKWKDVRKHNQMTCIRNFVKEKEVEYDLNEEEKQELHNFIYYHLLLKNLHSSNFDYRNGKLEKIENLTFNEEKRKWKIVKNNGKGSKAKKAKKPVEKSEKVRLPKDFWVHKPPCAELDAHFTKQVKEILVPKISDARFIPSLSVSNSNA